MNLFKAIYNFDKIEVFHAWDNTFNIEFTCPVCGNLQMWHHIFLSHTSTNNINIVPCRGCHNNLLVWQGGITPAFGLYAINVFIGFMIKFGDNIDRVI